MINPDEFVVWDSETQSFVDDPSEVFYIDKQGNLCLLVDSMYDWHMSHPRRNSYFRRVGKTDTEGKEIYAESSVVEFVDYHNTQKPLIGYFKWDNIRLSYDIRILNFDTLVDITYCHYRQTDFKIIGTLQERPDLITPNKKEKHE